jgi:undecaprenyl phosphate-alpha-L-ara4N flippase subunit ArnE
MNVALLTALLLAGCIAAETAYQTCFKVIASRAHAEQLIISVAAQPLLWITIALWSVETLAWIIVLHQAPLAIAYPIMCLTYASVPLAGAILLKEKLSGRQVAGAAFIFFGVLAVTISSVQGEAP